jgi:hypothetical protein
MKDIHCLFKPCNLKNAIRIINPNPNFLDPRTHNRRGLKI